MHRRSILVAVRSFAAAVVCVCASGVALAQERGNQTFAFAAASLKTALDEVVADFKRQGGNGVTVSYAASSTLARQIEQGAPADIFISADLDWMDYLQQRNLINVGTRSTLLRNELVLVANADDKLSFRLAPDADLAAALGNSRLAVGEVNSVPAGKYAKESLEKLGIWSKVSNKLAPSLDVRAALNLVARGEARLGIVYATDARAEPKVKVIDTFPENSHPPILYPAALTAASKSTEAPKLLEFLRSPASARAFTGQGFVMVDK